MANRLAEETSPYLLQHKDNPVDWYPWGPEALERSRREDKPILLSVGYAACHWCHVMERESFEDPDIARVMNEEFVCIKVDREERPDIDAIYMESVQVLTGQGGWPMTVFLTPDGAPFFGGTYFPPEDRHGLPGFVKVLRAVADAWKGRRPEVERQGRELVQHMGVTAHLRPSIEPLGEDALNRAFDGLRAAFDPEWGGFGSAPKFPQPTTLDFVARMISRGARDAETMLYRSLDAMAAGGVFDQIGGGFHRYSVDRQWIVPHFEKMLYDNGLLLRSYARAWVQSRRPRYLEVAQATARWLLETMRTPEGGFWSSMDADSEGEEGRYYVWSLDEVREVLGADADVAIDYWGLTLEGNFEGRNIPVHTGTAADQVAVERARTALLARRAERVPPATDTKIITSWNALTASALAEASALLDQPGWIGAAIETMEFLLGTLRENGRLMRIYAAGRVRYPGYADDYAYVLEACLTLYEVTHDHRWLDEAVATSEGAIHLFADEDGGFFTTGSDAEELVTRPKDFFDSPIASANSVLALELQRLALLTDDRSFETKAVSVIRLMADSLARQPTGFGHLLSALDFYTGSPKEIVIVGDPGAARDELVDVVWSMHLPNRVVVVANADDDDHAKRVPLLDGKTPIDGNPAAYVCHRGVCDLPVTDPDALRAQLER